ncbi:hypothetical protein OU798_00010 [Prolixibacteraceae bacterium Z1-6]|uniref:Uncharacterized protein n=1 Tax=Draconibacterium aestuarii TaxID=2998507 RepID=A0A9X3F160_9BACT|nr:hypothetical protein [Prolixibacteraceae bacterium Z1-6]
MEKQNKVTTAYKDEFYPPIPTKATKFWRTCLIFQIYSVLKFNLKIMLIVVKGHS